MAVITISREYGCAGELIAEKLCEKLNYKFINKELIEYIAILVGVPKKIVEGYDEEFHSTFKAVISKYFDLGMFKGIFEKTEEIKDEFSPIENEDDLFNKKNYISNTLDSEIFHKMVERLIIKLAQEDNVIILGRGSQCVLQKFKGAYHFRLFADIEDRIKWVSEKDNISSSDARKKILEIDRRKKNFVEHYYKENIYNESLYHLLINMSKCSIDDVVELIDHIITKKEV